MQSRSTVLCLFSLLIGSAYGQNPLILTGQYDVYRSGSNTNETILNTSNINPTQFGKRGSYAVDGVVFAQPLYVPGVQIRNRTYNVLYVATMHNSIYAFDADNVGSSPLWQIHLAPSVPVNTAGTCPVSWAVGPELGVLSTPVIDTSSGLLYAVYATPSSAGYVHAISAVDLRNGSQQHGSPAMISASVPGTGYDSSGGIVSLNQSTYMQRPALALSNGTVYASFASCGPDPDPYHGWVIGFSASKVQKQVAVFNTSPNGERAGIWQGGRGPAQDSQGSLYVMTGNGTNSSTDHGDSFLKLTSVGRLSDWFTPANFTDLDQYDLDLSSSGPLYIRSANLIVGGGKQGVIYVLNPVALGRSGSPVQAFQATTDCGSLSFNGCHKIFGIAFWDTPANPLLYVWGVDDNLRAFRLSSGKFNTVPDSQGSYAAPYPGGILAISSNGGQVGTGILWALTSDGLLHAFNATQVSQELWNSGMNSTRDVLGTPTHFAQPTVAAGKVFVPTTGGRIVVYGLLPRS